jgi:hypothetical protein
MIHDEYFFPCISRFKKIILFFLIKSGCFKYDDLEDLLHDVYLDLLEKKTYYLERYRKEVNICNFLSVVVANLCRKKRREMWKKSIDTIRISVDDDESIIDQYSSDEITAEQKMELQDYKVKLNIILKTFPKQRNKIEFCLKAYYRLPVNYPELVLPEFMSEIDILEIKKCIKRLNENSVELTDQEVYYFLTKIFNLIEQKENIDDAVRKYIKYYSEVICDILYGNPPTEFFDFVSLPKLFY